MSFLSYSMPVRTKYLTATLEIRTDYALDS